MMTLNPSRINLPSIARIQKAAIPSNMVSKNTAISNTALIERLKPQDKNFIRNRLSHHFLLKERA